MCVCVRAPKGTDRYTRRVQVEHYSDDGSFIFIENFSGASMPPPPPTFVWFGLLLADSVMCFITHPKEFISKIHLPFSIPFDYLSTEHFSFFLHSGGFRVVISIWSSRGVEKKEVKNYSRSNDIWFGELLSLTDLLIKTQEKRPKMVKFQFLWIQFES